MKWAFLSLCLITFSWAQGSQEGPSEKKERIAQLRQLIGEFFKTQEYETALNNLNKRNLFIPEVKAQAIEHARKYYPDFEKKYAAYVERIKADPTHMKLVEREEYTYFSWFLADEAARHKRYRDSLPMQMESLARPGDWDEVKDLVLYSGEQGIFPNKFINRGKAWEYGTTSSAIEVDNLSSFVRMFQLWSGPQDFAVIQKEIDRLGPISMDHSRPTEEKTSAGMTINALVRILSPHFAHPQVEDFLVKKIKGDDRHIHSDVSKSLKYSVDPLSLSRKLLEAWTDGRWLKEGSYMFAPSGQTLEALIHLYKTWPQNETLKEFGPYLLERIYQYQFQNYNLGVWYDLHYPLVELLLCQKGYLTPLSAAQKADPKNRKPDPEKLCSLMLAKLDESIKENLRPHSIVRDGFLQSNRRNLEGLGFTQVDLDRIYGITEDEKNLNADEERLRREKRNYLKFRAKNEEAIEDGARQVPGLTDRQNTPPAGPSSERQ